MMSEIGLFGLAVMGQNLALNVAEKGFRISVHNRSEEKVKTCVNRAKEELKDQNLTGYTDMKSFIESIATPRRIILLVQAGKAVDDTIQGMMKYLEPKDAIIDGGNEYYTNSERRQKECATHGILYMAMGVSGGEEGARHGPSLMPGGSREVFDSIQHILLKIAAQVEDGPCVTFIGPGGAGNYVKMIHNGIEYGDMQLIAEAYDILKNIGGLTNNELAKVFDEWNRGELKSFLIEITATIFTKKDDLGEGELIDKILDKSGSKGTGMWTIVESANRGLASPTISSALDQRYISSLKTDRVEASKILSGPEIKMTTEKKALIEDVKNALYCSKIMSYAQGMNLIKKASDELKWDLDLGEISRIWKGGCIIRAVFLDKIKSAYAKDPKLKTLLLDDDFAQQVIKKQDSWRKIICLAVTNGVPAQALSSSLAYYDSFRRDRLPANLIQAQRDFFGAHTFERTDQPGTFHVEWSKM